MLALNRDCPTGVTQNSVHRLRNKASKTRPPYYWKPMVKIRLAICGGFFVMGGGGVGGLTHK